MDRRARVSDSMVINVLLSSSTKFYIVVKHHCEILVEEEGKTIASKKCTLEEAKRDVYPIHPHGFENG